MAGWAKAGGALSKAKDLKNMSEDDKKVQHFFLKNEDKAKKVKKMSDQMRRQLAARKEKRIVEALKKGEPQVSMKQVLQECRMSKYYSYFRDAGIDTVELYARKTDREVEDLLRTVEKMTAFQFPYAHRVRIFKAIRMRWFKDPSRVRPYVDTDALPRLFLGKRDHRFFDADTDFGKIESERQRMICRRMEASEDGDSKRQQYEVRTRHPGHYYELRDVQRGIQEWRGYDPRRMLREDPREEYFMQRLRGLELRISKATSDLKSRESRKAAYVAQLKLVRLLFFVSAVILFTISISVNRERISQIFWTSIFSSKQLLSGAWCFVASQVAYGVATHKQPSAELARTQKMHNACKKLNAAIVTFRLDSADKRVEKYEEMMDELVDHFGLSTKKKDNTISAEELAAAGFDAWFEDLMQKPFNTYDCQLEMRESYAMMPRDPTIPEHPKDGLENKHAALLRKRMGNGVQEHTRAANPNIALQAAEDYFDEEAHQGVVNEYEEMRQAMERLVRAEQGLDEDDSDASSGSYSDSGSYSEEEGDAGAMV